MVNWGLEEVKLKYAGLVGRLRGKEERLEELRNAERRNTEEARVVNDASRLLLEIAVEHQGEVLRFLNGLVTSGLRDVFGDHVEVEFREETRSNQRAIDIILLIDGVEADIPEGVGGGLADMVALLVQLSSLYLRRGEVGQIIFLDEGLKHLGEEYRPSAARVIQEISKRLGIQVIFVTHQEEFVEVADCVYRFTYHKDGTRIERQ